MTPELLTGDVEELRRFLREDAAGRGAEDRARLVAEFARYDVPADRLHLVREALRERLPLAVVDPGAPHLLNIERLDRLSDRSFVVQGWAACAGGVASLVAVAPEGGRAELATTMFCHPRTDVEEFLGAGDTAPFGFVAHFELPAASRRRDGWIFELRDHDGRGVEAGPVAAETDERVVRDVLLRHLAIAPGRNESLVDDHLRPALAELQAARDRSVRIEEVDAYGTPPTDPVMSAVVPLYGRIDFLEHQLASFADDPELRECELIYVLDSPERAEELREYARQLHALYRLPFQVVTLSENGGFSLATNRGASIARAPKLLLLNSDVVPAEPGWAGRLLRFYDETPGMGALAPKLLYEDDAIQHAGIYFARQPGGRVWFNEHFYKGVHRSLPAANVARRVPAVTAACLLIDRALWQRLGGLSGAYVQGDYEDTDLCLRIRDLGLDCWYLPEAELYHLEGQSYPSAIRELSSAYNRWLHTRLWGAQIEEAIDA